MLVTTEIEDQIGYIVLNRPEKLNALTSELVKELNESLDLLSVNEDVKVIIISGRGKSFSAGGDIDAIKNFTKPNETAEWITFMSSLTKKMLETEKYIIAAVHGYAAGAGFSLALAADFIIAEKNAKFAISFTNIGLIPDLGLIKLLSERVSPSIAKEWISSGKVIDAQEAYEKMIINRITEHAALDEAKEFSKFIIDGPQISNKYVKYLVNNVKNIPLDVALMKENMIQTMLVQTEDHREGLKAFSEKRKPIFLGK